MAEEKKRKEKKEVVKGTNVSHSKKSGIDKKSKTSKLHKKEEMVPEKIEKLERIEKTEEVREIRQEETKEKEPVEIIVEKKSGFNAIEVVLIMIITFLFGGFIGGFAMYTMKGTTPVVGDGKRLPSELTELVQVYDEIKENYYDQVDTQKLLEAGIRGMMSYLGDPYSTYMSDEQTEDFNQTVNGEYVGIGAEISMVKDGPITISKVFSKSAAEESGLQVGDQIIKIGDEDAKDFTLEDASSRLKGKENTTVTVVILRGEEEKTVTITRKKVDIPSVTSDIIEQNGKQVGYLKIDVFAANTFTQFESLLLDLQSKNIDSLIIDVRDNSGGHLNVVEQIASLFVPKGKIVYQLETKGVKEPVYSTRNTNFDLDVVVLTNGGSASASEILAAALKESYGASLVGTKTYGKGTVQTTMELSSGAQIKYTIQKWLTPDGNWIHGTGITPDYVVDVGDVFELSPTENEDIQLQKAIDVLAGEEVK